MSKRPGPTEDRVCPYCMTVFTVPVYSRKKFCQNTCFRATLINANPDGSDRTCTRCRETKPVAEFRVRSGSHRRLSWCNACMADNAAAWIRKNPDKRREHASRWAYGISPSERAAMVAGQNGCCAVCLSPLPQEPRAVHLDHNHETGRIRGILCNACNLTIGMIRENLTTLARMIAYLEADAAADPETDDRPIARQREHLAAKAKRRNGLQPQRDVPGNDSHRSALLSDVDGGSRGSDERKSNVGRCVLREDQR